MLQVCPCFPSTTWTSSPRPPHCLFRAQRWERQNPNKDVKPALFLQKLCGKGKILIAIKIIKRLQWWKLPARPRLPVGTGGCAPAVTLCSRPSEPSRSPLPAIKLRQKTPSCPPRFTASHTGPHPALREPRRTSLLTAIVFTATKDQATPLRAPSSCVKPWHTLGPAHPDSFPWETSQRSSGFWRKGSFVGWDVSGTDYPGISLLGHLICVLSP